MKVELLDHMGDDLAVVNAARVSFDKHHEIFHEDDNRLIRYLATHSHWTPFSHCYAKFRIKAPLFVRSQLFKHKVGLTENEVSRRYVDSEPEFFVPEVWRKRAEDKKQGSSDECVDLSPWSTGVCNSVREAQTVMDVQKRCLALYKGLLEAGVCPEQARMVLPQSMYTEWIWSGSIAAFARVYNLRTSDHAQKETQEIAYQIGECLEQLFPVSWGALTA